MTLTDNFPIVEDFDGNIRRMAFIEAEFAKITRISCTRCEHRAVLLGRSVPVCAWCGWRWRTPQTLAGEISYVHKEGNGADDCDDCYATSTVVSVDDMQICLACAAQFDAGCRSCGKPIRGDGPCAHCFSRWSFR